MKPLRLILSAVSRAATRSRSSVAATAPPAAAGCPFPSRRQETAGISPESVRPYTAIPAPKGLPVIGTIYDIWKSGGAAKMHEYCHRRHQELGPIFRERLGNVDAVVISKKEYIEAVYYSEGRYPQHLIPEAWLIYNKSKGMNRGLFFMEGSDWLRVREILNGNMMSLKEILKYSPFFKDVVDTVLYRWGCEPEVDGRRVVRNVESEFYNWSIDTVGAFLFGKRLNCVTRPGEKNEMEDFVRSIQQIFQNSAKLTMIPPLFASTFNLSPWRNFTKSFESSMNHGRRCVQERIEYHKRTGSYGEGLIGYLLSKKLCEKETTCIVADLLLAAADTTSHAAQWAFYMLAKNTRVQEQLYSDIQKVTGGKTVSVEHLDQLPLTKYIVNETLRMYPIAPFLTRIMPEDTIIGEYEIPAKKLVLMSQYTVGRDPERFPNPDQFKPERWMKTGRRGTHTAHCCMPFGVGTRSCIGRSLAEINLHLLLNRAVQTYEIGVANKQEVGISLRLITTPDQPIELTVKRRNKGL